MRRTHALRGPPSAPPRSNRNSPTKVFKLLECTDNNLEGWVTHAQGVSRLVEARGPDSFDSPLAHMILMRFRNTAVGQIPKVLEKEPR